MKRTKRIAASLAMAASMALSMSWGASAAGSDYTAVNGSTTSFDKYLVMNAASDVPDVSFEYTVAAGTARTFSASDKTIAVYPGPTPEKIAFSGTGITDSAADDCKFEIGFAKNNSTIAAANKAASDYVKHLDPGEKYAKKTVSLDFENVEFTEPGIYRYVITETAGNAQGITYDADSTRILDVYVVDKTAANSDEKTLEVTSYILHASDETIAIDNATYGSDGQVIAAGTTNTAGEGSSDYKSQGFTNEYSSYDLTFSKAVSGNQASKDKYFAFTVKIENAAAGTVYNVSYADDGDPDTTDGDADATIESKPNKATTIAALNGSEDVTQPATLTVAAGQTQLEQVFYLQHGQKIVIRGLTEGTKYTVSEDPEDYKPSAVATAGDDKNTGDESAAGSAITLSNNAMSDDYIQGNAVIDFTNTREGLIPTGVILSIAAPAGIGVAVIGGIAYLLIRNKRRKAEKE